MADFGHVGPLLIGRAHALALRSYYSGPKVTQTHRTQELTAERLKPQKPQRSQRGRQPQPKQEPRIPLMGTDGTARDRSKDQESQITDYRSGTANLQFAICNLQFAICHSGVPGYDGRRTLAGIGFLKAWQGKTTSAVGGFAPHLQSITCLAESR
jgi:hypothetical protein